MVWGDLPGGRPSGGGEGEIKEMSEEEADEEGGHLGGVPRGGCGTRQTLMRRLMRCDALGMIRDSIPFHAKNVALRRVMRCNHFRECGTSFHGEVRCLSCV